MLKEPKHLKYWSIIYDPRRCAGNILLFQTSFGITLVIKLNSTTPLSY